MAITESRIRMIIREEARRVLREQGVAQQAGAKIDQTAAAAGAAATGNATPQQIATLAGTYTDILLAQPVLSAINLIPGGREQVVKAVTTYMNGHQQVLRLLLAGTIQQAQLAGEIANLVRSGQLQSTMTTMMGQGKGVAEVIGAVLDLVFSKFKTAGK